MPHHGGSASSAERTAFFSAFQVDHPNFLVEQPEFFSVFQADQPVLPAEPVRVPAFHVELPVELAVSFSASQIDQRVALADGQASSSAFQRCQFLLQPEDPQLEVSQLVAAVPGSHEEPEALSRLHLLAHSVSPVAEQGVCLP